MTYYKKKSKYNCNKIQKNITQKRQKTNMTKYSGTARDVPDQKFYPAMQKRKE